MRLFRKPVPYTNAELTDAFANIAHLAKLRDASLQKALTYSDSDVKQQAYLEEVDRYTDAIEVSQQVYDFMITEVQAWQKGKS